MDCFLKQLRNGLNRGGELDGRGSQLHQRLLHSRSELSWCALEPGDLQEGGFVVDWVLAVQGEQRHYQLVDRTRQASGSPVCIRAARDFRGECGECEFRHEQEIVDYGASQGL